MSMEEPPFSLMLTLRNTDCNIGYERICDAPKGRACEIESACVAGRQAFAWASRVSLQYLSKDGVGVNRGRLSVSRGEGACAFLLNFWFGRVEGHMLVFRRELRR